MICYVHIIYMHHFESCDMNETFDIQKYMQGGVERILRDSLRATMGNIRAQAFFLRFAKAVKKASAKRMESEKQGFHVPAFLISSIASNCNLHCAGCYSRCNGATTDCEQKDQLTSSEWGKIFKEAEVLGISFILLAGGEPLLRKDVINEAAKCKNILFPIFTNGTFLRKDNLDFYDKHRNLIPVISIEGDREKTDARRGKGVYDRLVSAMDGLKEKDLLYGVSVTVTSENLSEVTSENYLRDLSERGCKLVIYVEYVPVSFESSGLALSDEQRDQLLSDVTHVRETHPEIVFVSFPGDEKSSGGCLAAGRGFFHINSNGGAEPCPFSPYSDINVRDTSLKDALNSPLFQALQQNGLLMEDHKGGCVLFEKKKQVEGLLSV